jgi:uncharacterized protein YceH (UPF0502 family)
VSLTLEQGRVIGCLVEKQLTTPQQYPLTLNALVLACNQTSNRDPVVTYEESLVQRTLASLKEAGLVRFVYPSSGRSATRYRHVLGESIGLEDKGLALIAVLLLRGPQTAGELRTRTERMVSFDGLGALNLELEAMAARAEPLVVRLARRPGQKEERWVQLLTPETPAREGSGTDRGYNAEEGTKTAESPGATERDGGNRARQGAMERLDALEGDLTELKAEVAELRAMLDQSLRDASP